MSADPGPHELQSTRLVFGPDGRGNPKPVTPAFYEELDFEFDGFAGHLLIARHDFDAAQPTWEMHPKGDEMVYLLSGDVDFVFWTESGEKVLRLDQPGHYLLVPRGTWHTARPRQPSGLLFVTPGEDTRHAALPPGAGGP